MTNRLMLVFASALGCTLAMGCSRKSPDREWTASDHDRADETSQADQTPQDTQARQAAAQQQQAPTAQGATAESEWAESCSPCHGISGKGDGPVGKQMMAPDLTNATWQKRTSDDQISGTIVKGKGKMPAFKLPPQTVDGLVKKVRALR
jgi:mono/diheme cytochrome c family protein